MKRLIRTSNWLLLTAILICISLPVAASKKEADVKAAYIFNFTKFISGYNFSSSQFNICLYGSVPNSSSYRELSGNNVSGKSIQVKSINSVGEASSCQLIYAPNVGGGTLTQLASVATSNRIVLVGDGRNFINQGGMVGLVKDGSNVKFELNQTRFRDAKLRVSSKLYKLAVRVK